MNNQKIIDKNLRAIGRNTNPRPSVPTKEEWIRQQKSRKLMLEIESKHQMHKRCIIGCVSAAVVFAIYALLTVLTSINIYCLTAAMCAACFVIVICLVYFNAPVYEYKPTPRKRERR